MSIEDNPALMNTEPNRAACEAMRMSQLRANAKPPPTATPLTAAMIGTGHSYIFVYRSVRRTCESYIVLNGARAAGTHGSPVPLRSAPEQKPRPAPVRT